jgi:protein subunit release factor B
MIGQFRRESRKGKVITVNGQRVNVSPTAARVTHLSEKSTSKMSRNVQQLNKKVLQYINNQ